MKGILVYQPPDKPAQLPEFIDSLDPRLREKIIMQLYQLSKPHKPELREPHFKRFSLERYDPAGRREQAARKPGPGCEKQYSLHHGGAVQLHFGKRK